MQINVTVKGLDAVKQQLASLSQAQMGQVIVMAINKTTDKGRAEITRAITERYAIRADETRNSITLSKASAAQGRMQGTIGIFGSPSQRGRSMNMIRFVEKKVTLGQAKKRRKAGTLNQLHYNIIKGAGGKMIPGSFIGNDGRTVFMREGKARLPIKPVQVIGVSQMFNYKAIRERVLQRITTEFNVELNRAIAQKLRSAP
jgi:hypothetical protein